MNSSQSSNQSSTKKVAARFMRKSMVRAVVALFSELISYINSVMPLYLTLHKVVSFLRLAQFMIVSHSFQVSSLYPKDSFVYKVGNILSVLTRPWPLDTEFESYSIFGWIALVMICWIIPFQIGMSYSFRTKGTLPQSVVNFYTIISSTVEFLVYPMICNYLGGCVFQFQTIQNPSKRHAVMIQFTLLLIFQVLNILCFSIMNAARVSFIPTSLATLHLRCQVWGVILICILAFISELKGNIDAFVPKLVWTIIQTIVMGFNLFIFSHYGIIVEKQLMDIFTTTTFVCSINLIIQCVFIGLNKPFDVWIYILDFALFILSYLSGSTTQRVYISKVLQKIDEIQDNNELISEIKSYFEFCAIIITGFRHNHPYCLNFSIFQDFVRMYPDQTKALTMYAKFVSMYPEESAQLQLIYVSLKKVPKRSMVFRSTMKQIKMILLKRDTTLRTELKKEIESCHQLVTTCKLRLRMIWEAVLEGSKKDLGSVFQRFQEPLDQIEKTFTYFRNYHPNSPYACQTCAQIARDVMRDPELAEEMQDIANQLQRGNYVNTDCVQVAAFIMFPTIPRRSTSRFTSSTLGSSNNETTSQFGLASSSAATFSDKKIAFENEEQDLIGTKNEGFELIKQLKSMINTVSTPSVRFFRWFSFLYSVIFCIFGTWFMLYVIMLLLKTVNEPANFLTDSSLISLDSRIGIALSVRLYLEKSGIVMSECDEYEFQNAFYDEKIGGSCDTVKQLEYFAKHVLEVSSSYSNLLDYFKDSDLSDIYQTFFDTISPDYTYDAFNLRSQTNSSVHQQLVDCAKRMAQLASTDDFNDFVNVGHFGSLIANSKNLFSSFTKIADQVNEFVMMRSNTLKLGAKIEIGAIALFVVVLTFILLKFGLQWVGSNEKTVFDCFNSIPKSTISKIIEKLDSSNDGGGNGGTNGMRRNHSAYENRIRNNMSSNLPNMLEQENSNMLVAEESSIQVNTKLQKAIQILRAGEESTINVLHVKLMVLIILLVVQLMFSGAAIYLAINNSMSKYGDTFTQLRFVADTFSSVMCLLTNINLQVAKENSYNDPFNDWAEIAKSDYPIYLDEALSYYELFTYGNGKLPPIGKYVGDIYEAINKPKCQDNFSEMGSYHYLYSCYDQDSIFMLMISYIQFVYSIYIMPGELISVNTKSYLQTWHIALFHQFPNFFYPLFVSYADEVALIEKETINDYLIWAICTTVLCFLIFLLFNSVLRQMIDNVRSMLGCLLYVPTNTIMKSQLILQVMNNDFNRAIVEDFKDTKMYDNLFSRFTDGIIVFNSKKFEVLQKNDLGNELMQAINDFHDNAKNQNNGNDNINIGSNFLNNNLNFPTIPYELTNDNQQIVINDVNYLTAVVPMSEYESVCIIINIQKSISINQKIIEEKEKLANMYSTILPQQIIQKLINDKSSLIHSTISILVPSITAVSIYPNKIEDIAKVNEILNRKVYLLQNKIDFTNSDNINGNNNNNNNNNNINNSNSKNNNIGIGNINNNTAVFNNNNNNMNDNKGNLGNEKENNTTNNTVSFNLNNNGSTANGMPSSNINNHNSNIGKINITNSTNNFTKVDQILCNGQFFTLVSGIFVEVNIAETHAREMTDLSVEICKELEAQKVDAQIGISTGGPAICCMLSLDKPSFDIYGESIEMSQEMAMNGMRGEIHITRSVYELIYGGKHTIRERGEVQLYKFGKVVTYFLKQGNSGINNTNNNHDNN